MKKKQIKAKGWSQQRANLKAMAEKYPNILLDIIDAAYLAGLEATLPLTSKKPRAKKIK